jgi:hypothetical protein
LLSLLKAIDGLMHATSSDLALRGQIFKAQGTFYRQPPGQRLTLEEMLQLLTTLNPAELQVLHTLVPYYFDRTRYADGQLVSATWGTTSPHLQYASNVVGSAPEGVSLDEIEQRTEQVRAFMTLFTSAQQAKAAGDDKKASELFEQVIALLKEHGTSEPMLDYLRSLFQN